jgi:hypothetical protein
MHNLQKLAQQWLPVVGYEGLYEISDLGNVRSCPRKAISSGRVMNLLAKDISVNKKWGTVSLYCAAVVARYHVSTFVATAFVPNPNGYKEIKHKNGNRLDNRAENLEWVPSTKKEKKEYKSKSAPIIQQLDEDRKVIKEWPNTYTVFNKAGLRQGIIHKVCCGLKKDYAGFTWRYKDHNLAIKSHKEALAALQKKMDAILDMINERREIEVMEQMFEIKPANL